MKKKLQLMWVLICLVLVILPIANTDSAQIVTQHWKTYTIDNKAGGRLTTYISTSSIRPNVDKILGFSIIGIETTNSQELIAFFYDATTGQPLNTILGELETIQESTNGIWFPYSRKLENGLTVMQGAYTTVIIYYDPF